MVAGLEFLAQRFACLRAGVIELARLADDDRSGADEEDGFDVGAFWHLVFAYYKTDWAFFLRRRWGHQLANCFKNNFELFVVFALKCA
jgi:hypothetical protein